MDKKSRATQDCAGRTAAEDSLLEVGIQRRSVSGRTA